MMNRATGSRRVNEWGILITERKGSKWGLARQEPSYRAQETGCALMGDLASGRRGGNRGLEG